MRQLHKATLRTGLVLAGMFILTGAKGGEGCGGGGGEPTEPPACEAGFHLEKICEGSCDDSTNGGDCDVTCEEVCVADGCPDGTVEQLICEDTGTPEPDPDDGTKPDDAPGGDEGVAPNCWTECVAQPDCPPGMHLQKVCEEHDCGEPECELVCVDDGDTCDPSLACGDAPTCVDGLLYPSTCGPDNCDEPIDVCDDECDPNLVCGDALTCVDGLLYPSTCGPDNCDEPIDECDDECDPSLVCAEVISCFEGQLYPTACGPDNCDEPIGECDK